MGLIERIKSALGLGTSASSPSGPPSTPDRQTGEAADDAESDDVDVTVEHEPDAGSEEAVKGTDTAATGTSADVAPADGAGDDTESEADDAASDDARAGAGVDLEEIKGIGPAYAHRLREAGIEDVAALAAADPAEVADRTDLGEGRLRKWIDRVGGVRPGPKDR
ncbi:MAG: helix-hairpin-helix domain-containing protein [Haloarculaceae archaeon]